MSEETTTETVETGLAEAPTSAVAEPTANGEKELSPYKKRQQELGIEGVGAEIPTDLADMIRAAAKASGDIAIASWVRKTFAEAVNALNLVHPDTKEPWVYDISKLELRSAKASTRGLTDEQKAAKLEVKKVE